MGKVHSGGGVSSGRGGVVVVVAAVAVARWRCLGFFCMTPLLRGLARVVVGVVNGKLGVPIPFSRRTEHCHRIQGI